jgi:Mce-associated membrane protein
MAEQNFPVTGSTRLAAARKRAKGARAAAERASAEAEKALLAAETVAAEGTENASSDAAEERAARGVHRRSRRDLALMVTAALVAASAGAISIVLAINHHTKQARADEDVAIVLAAREQVVNLLTIDKNDVTGYSDRVLAGSTGRWQEEFTANKDAVMAALTDATQPTSVRGVAAGIEERGVGGTSAVDVGANTIAGSNADEKQPGTAVRMRVGVTEVDGQWKLSKVEIVR